MISDWMSISRPRVNQKCCFCGEPIGRFGIIIRLNHKSYLSYVWAHLNCLKGAKPSKMQRTLSSFSMTDYDDEPVLRTTCGCSFCGVADPKVPILSFGAFYMHENCLENAYKTAYGVFLDNEKELLAKMI